MQLVRRVGEIVGLRNERQRLKGSNRRWMKDLIHAFLASFNEFIALDCASRSQYY
jgi:hypothetical protein